MTFRKPVRGDFPEGRKMDFVFEAYEESDGCDDGLPQGWQPCITGDGTKCNFYGKDKCYHDQGVE